MSTVKYDNMEELLELSEEERKVALEILQEYSKEGKSETYSKMMLSDFKEIPVDIITFVKDPKYLGKAFHLSNGKCKLFPYWEEVLKDIFPDNMTTRYNNAIFSGARGLGKSEIAVVCGLYIMYRLMCLKNPHQYLNLKPTEKVAFAFMNITEYLAYDIGVSKFQNTVQMSPWFMERGTITGKSTLIWNPPDFIDIIVGSQPRHVIGQPILFFFMDEVSFIPTQSIESQKKKALDIIDTAIGGAKTRFNIRGKNPSLIILASSKRSEKSFLEEHMKLKLKTEGENTKIVDEPVWNVRPSTDYSGKKFYVAQGNKFLASEVIKDDSNLSDWRNKGYRILEVPIEYKSNFEEDIDRALCDFAGVSASDLTKYISGPRLLAVKHKEIINPFIKEIIEVGNANDDTTQYYDFFDITKISQKVKYKPLFIHLDMSLSGDRTGISGIFILGKKPGLGTEINSKELYYQEAFHVAIKAPKGYQVSFAKNREFIYWLKKQGFNIRGISSDTFQNAELAQDLISKGYKYEVISVDRCNSDKICEPYAYFKNCIYEQRVLLSYECDLLTEEITNLERDSNSGKIDHPDGGKTGCFTGDTKISLVDGREVSLLDLVKEFNDGKENYVYSFNEKSHTIEPKKILNAWCTQKNAKLLIVELDNGEKIKCTLNHRFMLRDGSYKEAQYLVPNESLMPLYRKYPSKGVLTNYRMYYEPMEDRWHFEHRKFAENVYDEKHLVHHINFNPHDNSPNNLLWMSKNEHINIHKITSTGACSEEARKKRSISLSNYYKNNKNNEVFIERNKKISKTLKNKIPQDKREEIEKLKLLKLEEIELAKKIKAEKIAEKEAHIKEIEDTFNIIYENLTAAEKNSYGNKLARLKDSSIVKRISNTLSQRHKEGLFENAHNALKEYNESIKGKPRKREDIEKMIATKKAHGPYTVSDETKRKIGKSISNKRWFHNNEKSIYIDKDAYVPDGFIPGRLKTWKNHKVIRVYEIFETEDVYDLTIEDNHNFALSSGVFVHNSKDCSDAVCGAIWNASRHADEYNFEYGEDINSMSEATLSSDKQEKEQIILDFEEALKEAVDYKGNKIDRDKINVFKDFGAGKATTDFLLMNSKNGIVVF